MSTLLTVAYLGAGILFILSLGGLSTQNAGRGNIYGITGMIIALLATLLHPTIQEYAFSSYGILAATIAIGSAIGAVLAASEFK